MSSLYLNKDLLSNTSMKYYSDDLFFYDVYYYILKRLGYHDEEPEIESRRCNELDDNSDDSINAYMNNFITNYNRLVGSRDYVDFNDKEHFFKMYEYLVKTFPYCFFSNEGISAKDIDSALLFYAKHNLRAKDNRLADIIPVMKTTWMRSVDSSCAKEEYGYDFVFYSKIRGTIVDKYKAETLYETLQLLGVECVNNYINYILRLNGLNEPLNIIRGNPISFVEYGNDVCIKEGNKRLLIARALHAITATITFNCNDNNPIFHAKVYKAEYK